eukprot:11809868-Ditylum_brightwellii.AAC.1
MSSKTAMAMLVLVACLICIGLGGAVELPTTAIVGHHTSLIFSSASSLQHGCSAKAVDFAMSF